jgi:hypothetical protein
VSVRHIALHIGEELGDTIQDNRKRFDAGPEADLKDWRSANQVQVTAHHAPLPIRVLQVETVGVG